MLPTDSWSEDRYCSLWKEIMTIRQVKRGIVKTRILIGTYTLQSHRNTFSRSVDPTCPHCQLEAEDLRHMICRCPVFHEDRVPSVKRLKQTVMQEVSSSIWDFYFTDWENKLKVLVCPDTIRKVIPELTSIVSKTEQLLETISPNIHVKKLRLQQKRE